jgi:Spy/CpxP family protein refolding chaperone
LCASVIAAFTLLPAPASAQDPPPARERLEEYGKRLNLTPEQREKIRPILEAELSRVREIRDKYQTETRRERRQMLRELRAVQEDIQKQIEPILTKEQKAEWKKIREERREELRDRGRQGRP